MHCLSQHSIFGLASRQQFSQLRLTSCRSHLQALVCFHIAVDAELWIIREFQLCEFLNFLNLEKSLHDQTAERKQPMALKSLITLKLVFPWREEREVGLKS